MTNVTISILRLWKKEQPIIKEKAEQIQWNPTEIPDDILP
jgi:hypothetical protein